MSEHKQKLLRMKNEFDIKITQYENEFVGSRQDVERVSSALAEANLKITRLTE